MTVDVGTLTLTHTAPRSTSTQSTPILATLPSIAVIMATRSSYSLAQLYHYRSPSVLRISSVSARWALM